MAKFLQPMKELMVWEVEISRSLTLLYEAKQWGRKQFVATRHSQWPQCNNKAVGYFHARLLLQQCLAPLQQCSGSWKSGLAGAKPMAARWSSG